MQLRSQRDLAPFVATVALSLLLTGELRAQSCGSTFETDFQSSFLGGWAWGGPSQSIASGPLTSCLCLGPEPEHGASRQETAPVHGIRCRCPPAEQRAPFVRGCVPEVSGPSHETGRVRMLTQRMALTTAWPAAAHRWFSYSSADGLRVIGALVVPVSKADVGRFHFPGDGAMPRVHPRALRC